MSLAILVPVLDRPQNVVPLLDSIEAATSEPYSVHFICNHDDLPEIQAIQEDGRADSIGIVNGGYAEKINHGVRETTEPLILLAADDLRFKLGWLEEASSLLTEEVQVVGVNDLLPRRRTHATHFLITRSYAERAQIDGAPGVLHEGYAHNFVDDELIATAMSRGAYAYAERSHVQHLHPMGGTAEMDDTYRRGQERMRLDRKLFRKRGARLWR